MAGRRPAQGQATQYQRTIEQAERDAEVARYRARHPEMSLQQIADHFGVSSKSSVHGMIKRAIQAAAAKGGADVIASELLKIDALEQAAWAVLNAHHIHVSDGRVVVDPKTKELLTDPKPVLMAIDRVLKCQERRAKLLGLDAPTRQVQTITVITEDAVDAECRRLEEELAKQTTDAATPGS